MGFNPRDFMTVEQAQKQSMQPMQTTPPPAPSWTPQYAPQDAYSTTVMPETGAPGPNHSLAGNRNYTSLQTANDLAKMGGGRVLQANMAGGPTTLNNANQYAIDFGIGDPLNAGQLAARYDTSDPTRDKFWDSPYWRDKALQDELTYAQKYNPTAQNPRDSGAFVGPANNPNYQWHVPQGGANYLNGGKAPIATANLSPKTGAGLGFPGSSAANSPAQSTQAQMAIPRVQQQQRSSLYGAPIRSAAQQPRSQSLYGAPAAKPQSSGPIVSQYRMPGVAKTF